MEKNLIIFATLLALTSCNFIRVNGKNVIENIDAIENAIESRVENANETTNTYTVASFTDINCSVCAEIEYTQGPCALTITDTAKQLENISVSSDNGILQIKSKNNRSNDDVKIRVSSETLESVTIDGAAEFDAEYGLKAGDITFKINGAGEIDIKGLDAKFIGITINGAGECDIEGRSENGKLVINGAGEINVKKLDCPKLETKINGMGRIERQ